MLQNRVENWGSGGAATLDSDVYPCRASHGTGSESWQSGASQHVPISQARSREIEAARIRLICEL